MLPIATDGAFLPDGKHFVIRNYAVAAVYAFPSLEKVDQFQLPDQQQGEGLAVDTDGSLLLSSEGLHSKVLRVSLPTSPPPAVLRAASPSTRTESHEDTELPETTETQRPAWPWFLGGLIGLGCLLVLTRSLRRRSSPERRLDTVPPCLVSAERPPTSLAGPAAARARGSPTSTSAVGSSPRNRRSGPATW